MEYAPLRVLTDLTGADATKDRTTVIATFEVSYPALWAFIWGLAPGGLLAAVFGSLFGVAGGLIGFMVGDGIVMFLILGRSSSGLKRKHFETLKDRNAFTPDAFMLCGKRIDPYMALLVTVMPSSVPLVPRDNTRDLDVAFGLQERNRVTSRDVDATAFSPLIEPRRQRRQAHSTGTLPTQIIDHAELNVSHLLSSSVPGEGTEV